MTPLLTTYAPQNFSRYFEPFVGSGAFFFALQPGISFLSDVNPEITATYQAIKDDPYAVHLHLSGIPRTKEAYLILRRLLPGTLSIVQRAARLIFLMKGCFNGVYRTNQSGQFNVPFGSTVYELPSLADLLAVSEALKDTEIKTGDYSWLKQTAQQKDFIYLDPPYSVNDRYRGEYGYEASFQSTQLDELIYFCNDLTQIGAQIMLSYKWNEQIVEHLNGWKIINLKVPRTVSGANSGRIDASEILAMNY
ncbi:MAG: Dam family site-specific DNA-(adenine-N6)-methyltransferase [Burkholderiales bacterium]|nr:Dam family site-specific DNA-(adenine-N6)-methyltransferase [Burkholderiales bacterium]